MANVFKRKLEQIRALPLEQRNRIALAGASIITLFIFAIWSVTFVRNAQVELASASAVAEQTLQEANEGPLASLGNQFSELFSSIKKGISQIQSDESESQGTTDEAVE